jgi:DNA-binding CsgD family transcriptional regulator
MIERLTQLLGGDVASYGEGRIAGRLGAPGWLQPMMTISFGWPNESDRAIHDRVFQEGKIEVIPWMSAEHCRKFWRERPGFTTLPRPRLFNKREWDRCEFHQEYARPAHCGEWLDATHVAKGTVRGLALFRNPGAKPFEARCCRWLSLFMREHTRLLGAKLASYPGFSVLQLPDRLREVLTCLMEGDGEKQIAAQLGISRHTVHYHVRELHRRFDASDRGRLLAQARPYWQVLHSRAAATVIRPVDC